LAKAMWVLERANRRTPKATAWMNLMLHTPGTITVDVRLDYYDNPEDISLHDTLAGMNEYKKLTEKFNVCKKH